MEDQQISLYIVR